MNVSTKSTVLYKRIILTVCAAILLCGASYAQGTRIAGKVIDKSGGPLVGISVVVDGTTNGTATGVNGEYSLNNVPTNGVLEFSGIGYTGQKINVNNRTQIDVQLEESSINLEDVVVTALGIKKEKKALGYSVQDVKSDELMKNKNTNIVNSLTGKIAGANVTNSSGAAGAGATIILRGGTSLERDNQPMFVIDGIAYNNSTNIGGNSGFDGAQRVNTTYSNRVMDINPEDVESMSVLKGPAAAALYGSNAAAGVVIITTKKGAEGTVTANFSSKFTHQWVNRLPLQQSQYKRGYYNSAGIFSDYTTQSWGEPFKAGETIYDNIKDFYQNASIWDNSVNVSGGSKNNSFFLSASDYRQGGIIPNTDYTKTTLRFNGEQKYGNLTVGANVAYSKARTNKTMTSAGLYGSNGTGAMSSLYRASRNDDLKHYLNEDGTRYRMFEGLQQVADDIDNPYWIVNRYKMNDETTRFTGGINLNYKVADWMDIMYRAGTDRYTTNNYSRIPAGSGVQLLWQKGMMSETDQTYEYLSSNLMLNFKKRVADFDLNLLVGQSVEDTRAVTNRRLGYNFVVDEFYSFENILPENKKQQQVKSRHRLMGIYGEFRVGYKSIAYLTFTGRNDWTSTLPVNNRSYFYPSVSGAFIFTELLPSSPVLTFGKIRASWARVGKDADPYVTNTYLWAPKTYLGGVGLSNSWTRGNPYLKPERTESTEIGLEMRFFKGRLGFDFAYYTNNSFDQLLTPRLSQTTGYILLMVNAGDIKNKGMELSVTGTPVQTKNFNWDVTLNLSGNRGKVGKLLKGTEILYVTDVQVGTAKAASFQYGNFMGISGSEWSRDEKGNVILDATTGMPTSDNSATHQIGNREPKFLGGLNNNFQYKNWNLNFLFDFRVGGDIYNGTDYFMTTAGMSPRSVANRNSITTTGVVHIPGTGVQPGTKKEYEPKTYTFEADKFYNGTTEVASGTSGAKSGRYIIQDYWQTHYSKESVNYTVKTNWMRLRTISLSYDLPKSLLNRTGFIKGVRATLSGTNLWLLTNYKGMDPEASAAGSGVVGSSSVGIDYCGVPSTAGVSFGLNITF